MEELPGTMLLLNKLTGEGTENADTGERRQDWTLGWTERIGAEINPHFLQTSIVVI